MGAYKVLVLVVAFVAMASYQAAAAELCAGCPVKVDPAKFDMSQLSRALATAQVNDGALKVLSVSRQVVAGLKYTVVYESFSGKICTASWIDAPWKSHEPLDTQISCRAKRSLLGGFEDIDESALPELENFGNDALNTESNGYRKVVMKVLKAQRQVVNGLNYRVEYLVKTTSCSMEQVPENTCMQKETAPREVCTATLHVPPYLVHGAPHLEVTKMDCSNLLTENLLAAVPAGNDEKYLEIAEKFAVHMINEQVNSLNYKGLYKVLNVDQMKVSSGGYFYTLELVLRDTDCSKNNGLISNDKCHFVANSSTDLKCKSKVWYWPVGGFTSFISNECSQ